MKENIRLSKAFNTPSLKELKNFNRKEYITNLQAPSWVKRLLEKIGRYKIIQGDQVIEVGRKIVEQFAYFVKKYPMTSATVILMCMAIWLIPNIPILGALLKAAIQFVGIIATIAFFLIEAFGGRTPESSEKMNRKMNEKFACLKCLTTE